MAIRALRHGTFALIGGLGVSLAAAQDAGVQPPPADAPLGEEALPSKEAVPDPLAPPADPLNDPAVDPNPAAPPAEPVPPVDPVGPDDPAVVDPTDPVAPVDPDMPLDAEPPAAPVDPAAEPAPPAEPPAIPAEGAPLPANDAGAPVPRPPVDGAAPPASPPPAPPADAIVPPPTYEDPGTSPVTRPTIQLGDVVREPVSIHEARARVLAGPACTAFAALDALAMRYPADARVAYLRYYLQFRMGQPEEALSSLERAVAMEYYQPVFDYNEFMAPIQGADRYYAERVRRAVQDLDSREALILPPRDEVIIPPPVQAEQE